MSLSSEIRKIRRVKKISRRELARRCGISMARLVRIERDREIPDQALILELASALDVSPASFFIALADLPARPLVGAERPPARERKAAAALPAIDPALQDQLERARSSLRAIREDDQFVNRELASLQAESREVARRLLELVRRQQQQKPTDQEFQGLFTELEKRRELFQREIRRPLLRSVLELNDRFAAAREELGDSEAGHDLEKLWEVLRNVLYQQHVEPIAGHGDRPDPEREVVLDREETADPALDGQVARVVRPGFLCEGAVLRPQGVTVWKHAPDSAKKKKRRGRKKKKKG